MWISGNPIDSNLIAANIKDGVSIYGVLGNLVWQLNITSHQDLLIPSYWNYQNTWTSAVLESWYCWGIEFWWELFLFRWMQVSSWNKYVRAFCRDWVARTAYPWTNSIWILPWTNTAQLRELSWVVYAHNAEWWWQWFTFDLTTKSWASYIAALPWWTTDIAWPVAYNWNTLTASDKLILLWTSTARVILPSFDIS